MRYVMRDDGRVNLRTPLNQADIDAADFPDNGPVYSDEVMKRESENLARRSLVN